MSVTSKICGATLALLVAGNAAVSTANASPGVSVVETAVSAPANQVVAATDRCRPAVSAYGKSGGYAPDIIKRQIARVRAISDWRAKVEARHGREFVKWRSAKEQNIQCDASLGSLHCVAEAKPCSGTSIGSLF